jgi:hypothetical protein
MPTALEATPSTATAGAKQAANNLRANLASLAAFQPELAARLGNLESGSDWVFARDGYLTSRGEAGWWSGCSVPLKTGQQLLRKLELIGTQGCFLHPSHAGQIRAAFEKLLPTQAVLAVIPAISDLHILLHCDDFNSEIAGGRLLFAAGENWGDELGAIFEKFPGLPLPQQFIRTPLLDDGEMSDLSTLAQQIISRETARRAEKAAEIFSQDNGDTRTGQILVLAGSRVNLADLSNLALRKTLLEEKNDSSFVEIDPDHPLTASPLALAEAAAKADVLLTADVFRSDLPNVVSARTAWFTWVTSGRIASFDANCRRDAVLLADPAWKEAARKAGWPDERIQIAGWPRMVELRSPARSQPMIGLFADTQVIEIPQKMKDFSSQLLLWEYIENELSHDPLCLGSDAERYLQSRMERVNIRDEGLDRLFFLDRLVKPIYKKSLSILLVKNGVQLAIFGRGWETFSELKQYARGPIESTADLVRAAADCDFMIEPFPMKFAPPMLGMPTVRPSEASTASGIVRQIQKLMYSRTPPTRPATAALSRQQIMSLM